MSSGSPMSVDPDLSNIKIQIIMNDEEIPSVDAMIIGTGLDRYPAPIHVGSRAEQDGVPVLESRPGIS